MDSQENNPKLPGAQILRLDSATSSWKVDLQLDERLSQGKLAGLRRYLAIGVLKSVTFDSDAIGNKMSKPADMIFAGVWDRLGRLEVFSKQAGQEQWTEMPLGQDKGRYAEVRSFGLHRDQKTGIQRIFAGARINGLAVASQIYSGAYDAKLPGHIRWDSAPEPWEGDLSKLAKTTKGSARITSFSECNGRLYATVYNTIYERQDGPKPSWKPVWTYVPAVPFEVASSGFRGLTAIPNERGDGQLLIVSLEHRPGLIFRIDPSSWTSTVDANATQLMGQALNTRAGYLIAAYNDMLPYNTSGNNTDPALLIGIEVAMPLLERAFHHMNPDAHYLVRSPNGQYSIEEIVDHALRPKPALVSVRSLIQSPFQDDPPGTIYASGFDANGNSAHNSAWIYRGAPVSAAKSD